MANHIGSAAYITSAMLIHFQPIVHLRFIILCYTKYCLQKWWNISCDMKTFIINFSLILMLYKVKKKTYLIPSLTYSIYSRLKIYPWRLSQLREVRGQSASSGRACNSLWLKSTVRKVADMLLKHKTNNVV